MHRSKQLRSPTKESSYEFDARSEFSDLEKFVQFSLKATIETGADLSESGQYEQSIELREQVLKGLVKLMTVIDHESPSLLRHSSELPDDLESVRVIWSTNPIMKEYNELTWECGPGYNNRKPYPDICGDDEEEEEGNSGFTMQARDSLICPISQGPLNDPVSNPNGCRHSYSRASIEQLIAQSGGGGSVSCPVSGCRSTINIRQLTSDGKLNSKLDRINGRVYK